MNISSFCDTMLLIFHALILANVQNMFKCWGELCLKLWYHFTVVTQTMDGNIIQNRMSWILIHSPLTHYPMDLLNFFATSIWFYLKNIINCGSLKLNLIFIKWKRLKQIQNYTMNVKIVYFFYYYNVTNYCYSSVQEGYDFILKKIPQLFQFEL